MVGGAAMPVNPGMPNTLFPGKTASGSETGERHCVFNRFIYVAESATIHSGTLNMTPQQKSWANTGPVPWAALFCNCRPGLKTRGAVLVLAVAGVWGGFANPVVQIPVLVLLYPAALTFFALCAKNVRAAFAETFLAGMLGSSAALYWIAVPIHDYGGLPWFAAVPCAIALGAYLGLYAGVFGVVLHLSSRSMPHRFYAPLMFAIAWGCLWAALEHARGVLFSGFPWLPLSSAFAIWPFAIQGASVFGVYALSGVFAAVSTAACSGCMLLFSCNQTRTMRTGGFTALGFCIVVIAGLGAWASYRLDHHAPATGTLNVLMVQGNIEQSQKWDESYQAATLRHYLDLTAAKLDQPRPPRLVVWPETAMPFFFQSHPLGRELLKAAQEMDMALLFGAPGFTPLTGVPRSAWPLYNRAYLLVPGQRTPQSYEKEHLVPFGEYLPSFLDFPALEILFQGVGAFSKGERLAPLSLDNLALGVLICYETIFPELAQARVQAGATLLVNISNDAWFGLTSAPFQHLHQTVMRAVEQGRHVIRCTNTGITALIDDKGRIMQSSGLYATETIEGTVSAIEEKTVFHRYGNSILTVMYGVCIIFLVPLCLISARRHSGKG